QLDLPKGGFDGATSVPLRQVGAVLGRRVDVAEGFDSVGGLFGRGDDGLRIERLAAQVGLNASGAISFGVDAGDANTNRFACRVYDGGDAADGESTRRLGGLDIGDGCGRWRNADFAEACVRDHGGLKAVG